MTDVLGSCIDEVWNGSFNEWISVDERLPEDSTVECLVWCGYLEIARYSDCDWLVYIDHCSNCDTDSYWSELSDVTYWMPLPEPPRSR